jgi:hypothetical protein
MSSMVTVAKIGEEKYLQRGGVLPIACAHRTEIGVNLEQRPGSVPLIIFSLV